ncbi:MAG: ribokinase [Kiritimatiellia bacterium]
MKPRILNFGSLNIDHVYSVDHFVRPGETLSSTKYAQFAGGKGNNQSIALAGAGADVYHGGKLGRDGLWLKERLDARGVNTSLIEVIEGVSGHAVIQVTPDGENAIVLHGGANRRITEDDAEKILSGFSEGDYLLLQNEISAIPAIIKLGAERKMKIVFNPAPMTEETSAYPLELVDCFILNRIEGSQLIGSEDPEEILSGMTQRYDRASTVLTLGAEGAMYADRNGVVKMPGQKVSAVDTTGAGDTFVGYFTAGLMDGSDLKAALDLACRAAALCVRRPGAADSIPSLEEIK